MSNPVALVTGGSRGIGRAIALSLARAGHPVAVLFRSDADAAERVVAAITDAGGAGLAVRANIGDAEEVQAAVSTVATRLGPPAVLVNNAFTGGRPPKKLHEVPPEAWAEDLQTNLSGPFLVTRACLPHMIAAGFGRVVFIGSLAARGEPGRAAYATAKAALTGLSGTIAREYARQGVTSNVVNPGFIAAGAFERLPDEIRDRALRSVPSRRAGEPEEVAAFVTFLASEAAGYLTGQVVGVDGGAR